MLFECVLSRSFLDLNLSNFLDLNLSSFLNVNLSNSDGVLQAHNTYPAGTYPQANQYPQAGTYPNQPYPQNTEGYNPAAYNTNGAYPNTATGTPVNGQNGVQMSALPHEKAGYQSNV